MCVKCSHIAIMKELASVGTPGTWMSISQLDPMQPSKFDTEVIIISPLAIDPLPTSPFSHPHPAPLPSNVLHPPTPFLFQSFPFGAPVGNAWRQRVLFKASLPWCPSNLPSFPSTPLSPVQCQPFPPSLFCPTCMFPRPTTSSYGGSNINIYL